MPDSGNDMQSPDWQSRLHSRYGRGGTVLLAVIALVLLASLTHVVRGTKPWDRHITQKIAQGTRFHAKDYGIIGVWWGCVATSVISSALLLGMRAWMPRRDTVSKVSRPAPASPGRVWLLALGVVIAIGAAERIPRLGQSLWNDEEYAMRRFAHGSWEQKNGAWRFDPVTWDDTLFEDFNGNNHVLNSFVTRCALNVWRTVTSQPREAFSEAALRLPSLIAGLLTLALIGVLGIEMGLPWAGIGAAGLLAFHPWHIRYAAEGKGYSLMLLFLCFTLLGLVRAFRSDKTTAWLCFAIGEAGCMLSFAGSLYPLVAINALAGMELWLRGERRRIGALVGFNLLAMMPVIVWMLPSVPQLSAFLHRPHAARAALNWVWLQDALAHIIAGLHRVNAEPELHSGTSWVWQKEQHPFFAPFLGFVFPALAVVGLILAAMRCTGTRLLVIALTIGGFLSWLHNAAGDRPLMVWYLIYLLFPLVFAVALPTTGLRAMRDRTQALGVVVLLFCYAFATSDARDRVIRHDLQPIRQTVAYIHDAHPDAITAVFGVSDRQTQSYDPRVRVLSDESDLDAALAMARREGRILCVYFCGRTESGGREPALMKRVLDPAAFTHVRSFPGLESMFSYEVYQQVTEGHPTDGKR